MTKKLRIFVSSVLKELAAERLAVQKFIRHDPLHRRFFEVVLFEDFPASGRRADQVYLAEVDRCDVYLCLLGNEYGPEDGDGFSPTEREFDRATAAGKERLVFVKGNDDTARHPKVCALLAKVGAQLIRKRFLSIDKLTAALNASLVEYLECRGVIQNKPFDERPCCDAELGEVDDAAVARFVRQARQNRRFPLAADAPVSEVLTHLGLLRDRRPTNAAILLFGRAPQRFIPCAEVRCMHFHGTEIERPAPFYQIFKGDLFAQVDQASNFIRSVLNTGIGTRALGPQAPVLHEIPPDVIQEAVVNAVAHRDYQSSAAVQVAVFADRVEIWNPGELPAPLTPDSLRVPHRSIARNHRLCESLFLAGYIEKYGTGTLMMIRESVKHLLPEPGFKQRAGEFVTTVWRDWLTEEVMAALPLNDRHRIAIRQVKTTGRITNAEYQRLTHAPARTATRDLTVLVRLGVLARQGDGQGTVYTLKTDRAIIAPIAPSTVRRKTAARRGKTHNQLPGNLLNKKKNAVSTPSGKGAAQVTMPVTPPVTPQVTTQVGRVLKAICGEMARENMQRVVGIKDKKHFFKTYLLPSIATGMVTMTIPGKPNSRAQKYRLTDKGRAWLKSSKCGRRNDS